MKPEEFLLYNHEVDIPMIQEKVSREMQVSVEEFNKSNKSPNARKRELVTARQLSMAFAKKYTNLSLARIGSSHGGRDHATVLHACKTIDNLLDTKDPAVSIHFYKLDKQIKDIKENGLMNKQEEKIFNTEK